MRTIFALVLVGLMGCGDVVTSTADLQRALGVEAITYCAMEGGHALVEGDCHREMAPGVACVRCWRSLEDGGEQLSSCASGDNAWCVASCDECPR